jgi:hypothetical protein
VPLAALLAILAVGLVAGAALLGGSPRVPTAAPPSPSRAVATASSAVASPSPAPSATSAPTPTATPDVARARLEDVLAAISAARGGPGGLKGKQANELESIAARVSRDLDAGDRPKALRDARELDRRIRDSSKDAGGSAAARLRSASAALVASLGG